jgi:glutamine---fructose-6-phosphate transaminase (isomerizing)
MCGIVGYLGPDNTVVTTKIVQSLQRLRNRGYSSFGTAFVGEDGNIKCIKKAQKKAQTPDELFGEFVNTIHQSENSTKGVAIGHNRWPTHGKVNEQNAHPHTTELNEIYVVHNGIIDNYKELRTYIGADKFKSQTDTEAIPHLISYHLQTMPLKEAVVSTAKMLRGAYAFLVLSKNNPEVLYGVRVDSPLYLGIINKGEYIIASSPLAIVQETRDIVEIENEEVIELSNNGYSIFNFNFTKLEKSISQIPAEITAQSADKGEYPHFMIKEIMEQPEAIQTALGGSSKNSRINLEDGIADFGGLFHILPHLPSIEEVVLVGMGTAYHACLYGAIAIQEIAGIRARAILATSFTSTKQIVDEKTLFIVVTQSGESSDTFNALKEAKLKKCHYMAIVNETSSKIGKFVGVGRGIYCHVGREIAVASTKAFTAQLVILCMLAVLLGRHRNLSPQEGKKLLTNLINLSGNIEQVLSLDGEIQSLATKLVDINDIYIVGKGWLEPIAYEGALKLQEVTYSHAEGREGGEFKHGYISQLQKKRVAIALAPNDNLFDKMDNCIQEIQAIKHEDDEVDELFVISSTFHPQLNIPSENILLVPEVHESIYPMLIAIVLQLLAYHLGVLRKIPVDTPRGLAKTVTVE